MEIKRITGLNHYNCAVKSNNNLPKGNAFNSVSENSLPAFNNSYAVAFMGKTDYTENELKFLNLRKQLARKTHTVDKNYQLADWNAFIDSNEENSKKSSDAYSKWLDVKSDKNDFEQLREIKTKGITNPVLKKSLDDIFPGYEESITYKDELEALMEKQNSVQSVLNNYRGVINGKEYTNGDLGDILLKEQNPAIRQEAYNARKGVIGDILAPKLVELAKARNEFAQKLGFSDYFSYMLKNEFEVDEKELFKLISEVDSKTSDVFNVLMSQKKAELAKIFNIEPDELQPWHFGIPSGDNPTIEFNKYFKSKEDVEKLALSQYKMMGWDIANMPITLDLFPRSGKNQHAYSFSVDTPSDSRILTNLRPDLYSHETLMHELGHSVYSAGISSHIPYFNRSEASYAMTEAFAMMNEKISTREGSYIEKLGVPRELVDKLDIQRIKSSLSLSRFCLQFITFEKELYANPGQDLAKLWYDLENKYLFNPIPKKLDNRWASERTHLVSNPAYYQNYFRAEIMASQIYSAANAKLGKLTENPNTAEFFRKNMFRFGSTLSEGEILKKICGKGLDVASYCAQFEKLLKTIK